MKSYFFCLLVLSFKFLGAQPLNPIITAFPALGIPTNSRGLAMGDCGIASSTENQQLYYNPAKSAFTQNFHQVSVFYTPWLSGITDDTQFMNLGYLSNVSNTSTIGLSLSYLSLGSISTRDSYGATIALYKSSEYYLQASYALKIAPNASLGIGVKFLASQYGHLLDPVNYSTIPKHIFSVCADFSFYHRFDLDGTSGLLELGATLVNLGPKISLGGNDTRTFLPTNFGIGLSYTKAHSETGNQFTVTVDANKLLVPSTPVYDNARNVIAGKDPNRGILNALFSSFTDAPCGFREELREIRFCAGAEFVFNKTFALRGGLSLENQFKGNRKFAGFGAGYNGLIKDQSWGVDMHYLIPFGTIAAVSPFQNNLGLTFKFTIGNFE